MVSRSLGWPVNNLPIDPKLARAVLDRDRYFKALNDALDALRDGQAMLAQSVIVEALGYEPRSEN